MNRVAAPIVCKLFYWNQLGETSDPTFDSWKVVLCTETIQCVNIISACTLYLRPFLETFDSGFLRADDLRRRGGAKSSSQSSYQLYRIPKGRVDSTVRTASRSMWGRNNRNNTVVTAGSALPENDGASQSSQAHIITETRAFTVETHDGEAAVGGSRPETYTIE